MAWSKPLKAGSSLARPVEPCGDYRHRAAFASDVSAVSRRPPELLEEVLKWANGERNVRVVLLTGSLARERHVDDLSDVDVELYVSDPIPLLEQDAWFEQFGTLAAVEKLDNPGWHPTRLAHYTDGKIDFMIAPINAVRLEASRRGPIPFKVLIDKDQSAADLVREEPRRARPSAEEFTTCINNFYAAAIMAAKYTARDEPWRVKMLDWEAKESLLRMIELDHRARYGWDFDTSYLGGRFRDWVDEDVLAELSDCWGDFRADSAARALLRTVVLFDRLTERTTASLRYAPFDSAPARARIADLLARAGAVGGIDHRGSD